MGILQQQVKDRLRSTVDTWQFNLQAKWGDPRVYQIQKATMERQDSDLAHDLSRRNCDLLTQAYERQIKAVNFAEGHRELSIDDLATCMMNGIAVPSGTGLH